mgnify:CR=1 FL=1
MSFKRSSYLNQIVKHNKTLSRIFPAMATLNSKVPGGTAPGSRYDQIKKANAADAKAAKTTTKTTSKAANVADDVKDVTKVANKVVNKTAAKTTTKTATKIGSKSLSKVPLLGPLLDIGMSGYFGADTATYTPEEKKEMGIKEDAGAGELMTYELLTGNSSKGSMFYYLI